MPEVTAPAVPEQVSIAMDEIAADLQVMQQMMEADVTAVCGPRGKHNPERSGVRHGTEAGSVTLASIHRDEGLKPGVVSVEMPL